MDEQDCVMYIIVNADLNMGKGKTASQCCHSACAVTRILERQQPKAATYLRWIRNGETKVVLRASQKEMETMISIFEVDHVVKRDSTNVWCTCVRDAGRTQIPENSLTTITFCPMARDSAPEIIKKLKLLN